MHRTKVPTSVKIALGLIASAVLVGVIVMRLSPAVYPQVAHANRQLVYDLEERRPPTPAELQTAADKQRTLDLNKCVYDAVHAHSGRLETDEVMRIVSVCRVRIFGPSDKSEAPRNMPTGRP